MVKSLDNKYRISQVDLDALNCVHEQHLQSENELIRNCAKDIIDCIKLSRTTGYEHLWIISSYDNTTLTEAKKLINWYQVPIKVECYDISQEFQVKVNASRMFVPVQVALIG